jgi:hypothetical protein
MPKNWHVYINAVPIAGLASLKVKVSKWTPRCGAN